MNRPSSAGARRRDILAAVAASLTAAGQPGSAQGQGQAQAQPPAPGPRAGDRVFLCNEDSQTLTVIDPAANALFATVNLTSFDEDPRPPFRFAVGGIAPTPYEMIQRPLYHGAIAIHGAVPSPDSRLLATTGRGSSNLYLIDTATLAVVGNQPNPLAGRAPVNPTRLSGGVLVGREPHEPTFSRDGRQLWVAVRGEAHVAVLDVARARLEAAGELPPGAALVERVPTMPGPAHAWFSAEGGTALVVSQKRPLLHAYAIEPGEGPGRIRPGRVVDLAAADPFGFSPFLKLSPDGGEMWISHKLADRVSAIAMDGSLRVLDTVDLGERARPNHVEFLRRDGVDLVYVTQARLDDGGPEGTPSSRIAIIDRRAPPGSRRVVGTVFTQGREAHGLWTDPDGTRLYVAHELDELPGTPDGGQTVCTCFDLADPWRPRLIARIPLGELALPSGRLRSRKSINLVYVRPGTPSPSA